MQKEVLAMARWDAIVVGGGVSGLSLGTLLAGAGRKVLVLEKENYLGGRASSTTYRGHIVDSGIHGLMSMGYMEQVLSRVGKSLPEYTVYEGTEALWEGGWHSLGDMLVDKEMVRIFTEGVLGVPRGDLEKLDYLSIEEWVEGWTKDKKAHLFFWFMAWAILGGHRYEDMSASALLVYLKDLYEKRPNAPGAGAINFCWGLSSLTGLLAEGIRERGGEVRTSTRVANIVIQDGKVEGVRVEAEYKVFRAQLVDTEFIEAPIVVSTLPIWHLFDIVSEDEFPQWYVDWIERIKHKTSPLLTLICGMKGLPWDNWKMTKWVPRLPRTGLASLFLISPATFGQSAGQYQVMFWLQTHWYEAPSLFETSKAKTRLGLQRIFDNFETDISELFPDFKKNCLWKIRHVDTFGLAEAPGVVGWHRPSIRPPGVEGLYLVSDTVREAAGQGIESCACAALHLVDQLLAQR